MHLYLLTRGIKHDIDRFINELSCSYLPFNYHGETRALQTSVRPIQLFEVVFPEEHLNRILSTCFPGAEGGRTQHKKHQKFITILRRILGVKPVPKFKVGAKMPVYYANIEVAGIGIKKDYWISKDGRKIDKWEEGATEAI